MTVWYDYRFKTLDLAGAFAAIDALRTLAILGYADGPDNMLGDPMEDGEGNMVLRARQGRAGATVTDPDTGEDIVILPAGEPGVWYLAIRTLMQPGDVPFNPAIYGLTPCDPDESRAVLGAWA